MNYKLSIKEIAKLTGVSTATVSRVINNNGRFSEKTRKKVQNVIEKYNYEPNRVAKSLRIKKSNTVGIVVPDITNSFFSSTVQQIEAYLFEKGYSTIICNTAHDQEKETKYLKILESEMVDGIIIISGAINFQTTELHSKLPLVCIDRNPNDNDILFVGSDHYAGAVLATKYLLKKVNDITLIRSERQSVSSLERHRGFQATVKEYQNVHAESFIYGGDDRQLKVFLSKKMGIHRPFGIFANSDELAATILLQAHLLNIKLPEEMRLVGFDDAPIAKVCYPQLTTVQQDEEQIAKLACNQLIDLMNHITIKNKTTIKIPVKLIIRGTA